MGGPGRQVPVRQPGEGRWGRRTQGLSIDAYAVPAYGKAGKAKVCAGPNKAHPHAATNSRVTCDTLMQNPIDDP